MRQCWTRKRDINRVILQFNMSFVGGWLFLLTKPSMFGKLEVHVLEVVWRFEPITFYISSLRVKLILATHADGSLVILRGHMNILFINKVKMLVFIIWSYRSS